MAKDYYATLGVGRDATREEIKKAYKQLAKKYHPDINKDADAAERFKEINEAAAVLGDEQKRRRYDQFGDAAFKQGGGFSGGGFDFSGFDFSDFGFADFGDIFESFFGGGRRRSPMGSRGHDLRADLEITLEQVATGLERELRIRKEVVCDACDGIGGEGVATCNTCGGAGMVREARRTPFGVMQTTVRCPACQGRGKTVQKRCHACGGSGTVERQVALKVTIPAGIEDGSRLRLTGEGGAGPYGAPAGDLYVVVHIAEHELFERDGDDVYLEVPISFTMAAIGAQIEVPTLTGSATLKVPAGTQPGTLLRMGGKGLPHLRGHGRGDQLVRITIEVPKRLTKKQRELLEEFDSHDPPHKRLFERIKRTFSQQ